MAFVHHESRECTKSELDLFTIPATQTSIHKGQWIEYHPLSNITDTGPIEFNVSGTGEEYLDLARTQLYVKAKITKANGTALDADTQVGPVNLFLHSLFSQIRYNVQDRLMLSGVHLRTKLNRAKNVFCSCVLSQKPSRLYAESRFPLVSF